MATLKEIASTLKAGDRTSRQVFDSLRNVGKEAQRLLGERDRAQHAINALTFEMAANPARLDELTEKLNQERNRHTLLTRTLVELFEKSDTALQPLADLTNAALVVIPGFQALEKHWFELPEEVARRIHDAASQSGLKLSAVPA